MKLKTCLFWSAWTFISATAINVSGEEEVQPYAIPGRYIVVLKHGHGPAVVANTHSLKPHHVYSHALNGFAGEISAERLDALRKDPRVDLIEPELQLFASAQTIPNGVKRIGANLSPMAKIDGFDERVNADIAILDTGIAPHSDLNIYANVSFIYGQTTDGNGHGTHVAGIAAALDNDLGVVGVAPGARLWAIKVLDDSGWGTTATIIQGIDYVTQNAGQIEVANLSLGGIGYSATLQQAISNSVARGVAFVVAAGNDSRDIYGPDGVAGTSDDSIPAAYGQVLAVSALWDFDGMPSSDDALAGFSNFSRSVAAGNPVASPGAAIDLAAPGVNIFSTYLNGSYAMMSGTSMASPHVAGAVALYIAAHGRATNAAGVYAIRQALINSAQPQSAWGSANTLDPDANHEGLAYVANIAPPGNNAPTVTVTTPATGASVAFGSAISFAGTATDTEDGNLTSGLVWTSSIDGQIGNGGSFSRTLSAGTHTITASATDSGNLTGSASVTITVLNPTQPALSVVVVTDKSSYVNGNRVNITATVTDGTNRVSGAAATLTLVTARGLRVSSTKTTDSNGIAKFQYKISSSRDGIGTYTATVTGTKTGYTSGNGSATFTVTR